MTELQIGKVHLRSYSNPGQWKVFTLRRSKKTGRYDERLVGWYTHLESALDSALEYTISEADCQSVNELKELVKNFTQEVLDEIRK